MNLITYQNRALFTDFYELTMLQGYFETDKIHNSATFELFFRNNPFNGGYSVVAGINDALKYLKNLKFHDNDINYLKSQSLFTDDFLDYLKNMIFSAEVWGVLDGNFVFPYEPILQITGKLGQVQLIETALLNIINYQTLIATKASRITRAAHPGSVIEFGLRRAQSDGGIIGSKAAMIGGCIATSNVIAGKLFNIPITGTHAHSWIQSFSSELEAFRTYAKIYPKSCVLLVDTYDVLMSGVPNAIKVGLEMKQRGDSLIGVRIDSGDLAWLSFKSAELLDEAGLPEVKIVLSNDLDEYIIESVVNQLISEATSEKNLKFRKNVINKMIYGVGTNLITGGNQSALGGVYKITEFDFQPVIKLSENITKTTNPGKKNLWRIISKSKKKMIGDIIGLTNEKNEPKPGDKLYHPSDYSKFYLISEDFEIKPLHKLLFSNGKLNVNESWRDGQRRYFGELKRIDNSHLIFLNPHLYKVSLTQELFDLKTELSNRYK